MDSLNLKGKPNNSWRPDSNVLKQLQESFCRANNVFCQCLAADLTPLTPAYGSGNQQEILMDILESQTLVRLGALVEEQSLESIIEEDIGKDYVKLAVIVMRQEGRPLAFWTVIGFLKEKMSEEIDFPDFMPTTSEEAFYASLELLEVISREYFEVRKQEFSAMETIKTESVRMEELQKEVKLHMAMNEILKDNEVDDTFAEVASSILKHGAEYLDVPFMGLLQRSRGTDNITEVVTYYKNGVYPLKRLPEQFHVDECPFFTGKTYIFSSDAILPEVFEKFFGEYDISAGIFLPIEVSGVTSLYFSIIVPHKNRIFSIADIKFANDMKKVLQNVLNRKVKQNSLAGSFKSLEAIINNLPIAVYVSDPTTKKVLFTNKTFTDMNPGTGILSGGEYGESGETEYFDSVQNKWYETTHSKITWVDGRGALLTTINEITDKKAYVQKMERRANNDFITGLYNRMRFEHDLSENIRKSEELNTTGAIIYLDLDDYRAVKEGIGRETGTELLKEVSRSLTRIPGLEDACYSMGMEQFSIIINHHNYPMLTEILLNIKQAFDKPYMIKGKPYYCYMNMGIAVYPADGVTATELMKKADIALFEAKRHGRNSYEYYIDAMEQGGLYRKEMEKSIMSAASENFSEFDVCYQPICNLKGKTLGAEALIRWNSRELGFIPPDDFIPMLEYMRLMKPVGDFVLNEALKNCRKWMDSGRDDFVVHVNLSVTQLMENDISDRIEAALKEKHVPAENLVIEVTESLAVNDLDRMKRILARIRKTGAKVALDDFGVGFASINYVRELPINMLKVDRSCIKGIEDDDFKQSFLKMTKEMGDTLGLTVCAEGVEKDTEAIAVQSCGVDVAQGYLYDKPLTPEQFIRKYV
ncbi:MAG: bifunctional diguanylate cyclase/phosphodiesterase [Lachnospiraceae bacterium]|nr:bifunctional diguanylate cyclase/phosphodiesterase [Lachnospiraceae bacterium]